MQLEVSPTYCCLHFTQVITLITLAVRQVICWRIRKVSPVFVILMICANFPLCLRDTHLRSAWQGQNPGFFCSQEGCLVCACKVIFQISVILKAAATDWAFSGWRVWYGNVVK